MHPVNLISKTIRQHDDCPALPCAPVEGVCALTGITGPCVPRKKLLGKSFTNGDVLDRPDSEMVSTDAYYALKFKWERMNSWFCDGVTFQRLTRQDVRAKVFAEEMPDVWSGYATTSYKKHGALKACLNYGRSRVWLFEERQVDCTNMERVSSWWNLLNQALRAGFGRTVLESLECPSYVINKVGLREWMAFERWARDKYLSSLYAFLCYLLPSQEELKHEQA